MRINVYVYIAMNVSSLLVPGVGRFSQTAPWSTRMGWVICGAWHCVVEAMILSGSDTGWPLLTFHREKQEQLQTLRHNVGSRIF